MRGKEVAHPFACVISGITPAYAGKRKSYSKHKKHHRDHPRVCGEKPGCISGSSGSPGSPPRMRGKVDGLSTFLAKRGITPAYAGKRWKRVEKTPQVWDHPRVCGEKGQRPDSREQNQGSPPRMRGKAAFSYLSLFCSRITPAYAGKRLKRSHRIGHFSCILCLFHSVLHRASASGGSRAGPCAPPCLPAQNAVPV